MAAGTSRVLVDTSAWIDALRPDGDRTVRASVRAVTSEGTAVLCDMVLLELWNGARGDAEAKVLGQLERDLESVATTAEVWRAAIDMARACRRRGITVPATDLLIAACAQEHGLTLLHRDAHFDLVADAKPEDQSS
ncbi:MAG: PIN domain nuclease [bacterium]|nr:PIN domain nuclease [bacterium]